MLKSKCNRQNQIQSWTEFNKHSKQLYKLITKYSICVLVLKCDIFSIVNFIDLKGFISHAYSGNRKFEKNLSK